MPPRAASAEMKSAARKSSLFGRERRRFRPRRGFLRETREARGRTFRPLLLSKLLGPRALRPPPAGLEAPAAPALARPDRDAAGNPLKAAPAGLGALEDLDPAAFARDRRPGAHWDGELWHDGAARGASRGGGWLWLARNGARWWAFADGRAQVRHDGVWWTKESGVWFVVHDGAAWAWRSFQDWDAQGLFQPASGTEMVYSKDFSRVAVISPGRGAEVFDAATGEALARIPEERLPPRRRPRAPAELTLPADVFAK